MARYRIATLNYITTGSKRTLVNMDTQMVYHNIKNIYILSHEANELSNIKTEQTDFKYLPTEYIEKEHPYNNRQGEYPPNTWRPLSTDEWPFPHSLSTEPLSEEKDLSSIILNEQQKYGFETNLSGDMRILLQQDSDILSVAQQADKFERYRQNQTFVIEDRQLTSGFSDPNTVSIQDNGRMTYVYPMYDIRDVSIKSMLTKQQQNLNLKSSDNYLGRFVDIYCPVMDQQPVGFCQINDDAYVMTDKSTKCPFILNTSIISSRNNDEVDDFYDIQLNSKDIDTYLYRTPQMLSAESYYQVLSGVTDPLYPTQVFTPARNMSNIEYNYMVVVDQQDNESIYDVGDIYAQQIDIAKNAYNSLYSMDISAASDGIPCANRCRDYRGVFTDGQYVYLKYYDNANYSQLSSRVNDGIVDQYMVKSKTSAYPFQKIETYIPNNFETRCKHKSNLFSINIRNKKIEDLKQFDDPECEKIYEQIHTEIKNAIRTIADNICPVNTQFFDVYFDK